MPRAQVDEQAILLAVINLLDNAMKYGGSHLIEVTIATEPDEISILVRDHGPGIPSSDIKRVFERFYRGAGRAKQRGSGIGLSLVKYIAEAHGGHAWAKNANEGGAIVAMTLPRVARRQRGFTNRMEPQASIDSTEPADIVPRHG
jgi:K+-sensing histidine kinase KdpD